jgi:hypothetical protein
MLIQFLNDYDDDLFGIHYTEDEVVEMSAGEAHNYLEEGLAIPATSQYFNPEEIRRRALYQTMHRQQK